MGPMILEVLSEVTAFNVWSIWDICEYVIIHNTAILKITIFATKFTYNNTLSRGWTRKLINLRIFPHFVLQNEHIESSLHQWGAASSAATVDRGTHGTEVKDALSTYIIGTRALSKPWLSELGTALRASVSQPCFHWDDVIYYSLFDLRDSHNRVTPQPFCTCCITYLFAWHGLYPH